MKSLLLLVHGKDIAELKANFDEAWATFAKMQPSMGDESNCLCSGEFEFDCMSVDYLAELIPADK